MRGTPSLFFFPGGRRALVVDAFDGERVVRALEENAIDEIVLFLSHSDQDHVEGMEYVLDNFRGRFLAFYLQQGPPQRTAQFIVRRASPHPRASHKGASREK